VTSELARTASAGLSGLAWTMNETIGTASRALTSAVVLVSDFTRTSGLWCLMLRFPPMVPVIDLGVEPE
jgi:hypothetical protein